MNDLKIKVCGMRDAQNIADITSLPINILGMIFYKKSARYIGEDSGAAVLSAIPKHIQIAGVFVNEAIETILKAHAICHFSYIQLHGNETPAFCSQISKETNALVIKAFQVDSDFSFETIEPYEHSCSFVLFDTKTEQYGGSGKKFDWGKINEYRGSLPFFLSGGISPDDEDKIKTITHPLLFAIDINSRFEEKPGVKNVSNVQRFVSKLLKK
jgi:phosphoribosylanthranilate isomerase